MVTLIPCDKLHLPWINEHRGRESGGVCFRLCSRNILLLLQVHTSSFYIRVLWNTHPFPLSEEMSQRPSRCMSRLNFRVQQLCLLNTLLLLWSRAVGGTEIDIRTTERWTARGRTHCNWQSPGSECSWRHTIRTVMDEGWMYTRPFFPFEFSFLSQVQAGKVFHDDAKNKD